MNLPNYNRCIYSFLAACHSPNNLLIWEVKALFLQIYLLLLQLLHQILRHYSHQIVKGLFTNVK